MRFRVISLTSPGLVNVLNKCLQGRERTLLESRCVARHTSTTPALTYSDLIVPSSFTNLQRDSIASMLARTNPTRPTSSALALRQRSRRGFSRGTTIQVSDTIHTALTKNAPEWSLRLNALASKMASCRKTRCIYVELSHR